MTNTVNVTRDVCLTTFNWLIYTFTNTHKLNETCNTLSPPPSSQFYSHRINNVTERCVTKQKKYRYYIQYWLKRQMKDRRGRLTFEVLLSSEPEEYERSKNLGTYHGSVFHEGLIHLLLGYLLYYSLIQIYVLIPKRTKYIGVWWRQLRNLVSKK